jgi:DNA-binding NarL/FixJ family response regulator
MNIAMSLDEGVKAQGGNSVAPTKLRIVIVEDSAIIRARLAESLTEIPNLEIVGLAETEQEAVTLLRDADWDAAILDLQLKKGTGLACSRRWRWLPSPRTARSSCLRTTRFRNTASAA